MKLLVLLNMFLAASLVSAQTEIQPTDPPATDPPATDAPATEPPLVIEGSCYSGTIISGVANITQIPCDFSKDSCQTKIEINGDYTAVNRQCKQTQACENNAGNNANHCYSQDAADKNLRVCFFCCQEDDCNNFVEIPEL